MKQFAKRLAPLAAALAALMQAGTASAIELDAGDYTPLPAGTTALVLYGQHTTRDKLYSQGNRLPINPQLDSTVGILRAVRFMEVGGLIIDPQFLLPFGRLSAKDDIAGLGSKNSVGDLILASAIWFTKPGDKNHFAITPYLYLPTGSYDRNQTLGLGENRYKFALQAGGIAELAPLILWDYAADVTLFGKNDDYNNGTGGRTTMKQKPLYQLQTQLRYQLSPALDLRAALFHSFGGETKVGGVDQNNRLSTTKFNVGTAWFMKPDLQLIATYGRDIHVREGFKANNQINLRLLKLY
ncbi:transporter [Alicycliphilus denitrificans]|uniref:Transporter n=1 Tax=Alicycliphilus denitrificans (strain DSM 14773 / CIP 107495 / K601) TaxID=596154 RepID=F4G7M6_ALIDK|nr:transporter [Alicycliphilus denitrificans]AEB86623.1 hypothetical protein Alide2_4311 [Alicycliphilus denitrificans K601]